MLKLIGTDGSRFYTRVLTPGTHAIGRDKASDLVVNDKTVSREHAIIEVLENGGGCVISDKGSRNGTMVNGERIAKPAAIKAGDVLMLGEVEFKVTAGESTDTMPPSKSVLLTDFNPEKSVFLTFNETKKPLPAQVTERPDVLPTLFEMAKILVLPEPREKMLETALKLVARVIPADRLTVLLTAPGGGIETAAYLVNSGKEPCAFGLSNTVLQAVLNEKNSILVDAMQDARFSEQQSIIMSDVKSIMAVPLFDEGQVLGILCVDTFNPSHPFDNEYLHLLAIFGNLIASRLLNYELMSERQEKQVFDAELRRASMIQRNLLTKDFPEYPGFELHAFQEQCRVVGGDLYDIARLPDGRLLFLVADVSGKGMGGALLMSNILASFRILYGEETFSLCRVVKQVSLQLYNYSAPEDFATLFIGLINPADNSISYVNAGHNPPLLRRSDGTVEFLMPSGTMIGAFDFSDWSEEKIAVQKGDALLVFTDGVVEANCHGVQYGDDRLKKTVCSLGDFSCELLIETVIKDVIAFVEDSPRSDDITMLAIKKV